MSGKKGQIDTLTDLIRDVFDIHGIKISMIKARLHAMDLYHRGCRVQVEGDVMEVVRCKDCDVPHNKWTGCPNLNGMIPPPDFYCAKGERKQKPDDVTDINVGDKPPCTVCERITEADKDIFWVFARTHQPEDKEEFHRVLERFCPACGREIDKPSKMEPWEEKENRYVQKD